MQTFLLKLDDSYINSLMDFIKPIPKENYEFKRLDLDSDINMSFFEDEVAYQDALKDLETGEAIDLNEYLAKRGIT